MAEMAAEAVAAASVMAEAAASVAVVEDVGQGL